MTWESCFSDDAVAWLDEAAADNGDMHRAYVKFRWFLHNVLEPNGNVGGQLTNIHGPLWEYRHDDYRMFLGWAPGRRIAVSDFVVKHSGRLRQSVYDHHERKLAAFVEAIAEGRARC